MITDELKANVNSIFSDKVRRYCILFIETIQQNYGTLFDIGLSELEYDDEERFVNLALNLTMKPTSLFIYGENALDHSAMIEPYVTNVMFIRPTMNCNGRSDLQGKLAVEALENFYVQLRRLFTSTVLDDFGIECSAEIDYVTFGRRFRVGNNT